MIKVGEIAKRLGMSVPTTRYRLKRYRILPTTRDGKDWLYADDTADRLAMLTAEYHIIPPGLYTRSDIARLMGVDWATVDRAFDGKRKYAVAYRCDRVKYYHPETVRLIAFRAADKHFRRKYPPNTECNVRLYYQCRNIMLADFNRKLDEEIKCRDATKTPPANPAIAATGDAAC
jgi:hypothetical protein